jgi:uncharacterized membrane protein YhfC
MDILLIAYIANPVLIFIMAIGLSFFFIRKFSLGWRLFFVGGATFLGAQLISIVLLGSLQNKIQNLTPTLTGRILLTLLFLIILMSIEEMARYAMYRWWTKDIRSWAEALLLGAGHGGVEAIIIGVYALVAIVQLIPLRHADLSTIVSPENLQQASEYVSNFWSKSWYIVLSDAVRSGLMLPVQLGCSLLMLQVFLRRQYRWLVFAIGWHTLANIPFAYIDSEKYPFLPLVFLAIATVGSVWMILRMQPQQELSV